MNLLVMLDRLEIAGALELNDEVEALRVLYNEIRPHETLDFATPLSRHLADPIFDARSVDTLVAVDRHTAAIRTSKSSTELWHSLLLGRLVRSAVWQRDHPTEQRPQRQRFQRGALEDAESLSARCGSQHAKHDRPNDDREKNPECAIWACDFDQNDDWDRRREPKDQDRWCAK
jgi:hypothetical protein